MATGKALNGKPYAGNPHVRFDEGEVAPAATPRRGSLLYRSKMRRIQAILLPFAALGVAQALLAAVQNVEITAANAYAYSADNPLVCDSGSQITVKHSYRADGRTMKEALIDFIQVAPAAAGDPDPWVSVRLIEGGLTNDVDFSEQPYLWLGSVSHGNSYSAGMYDILVGVYEPYGDVYRFGYDGYTNYGELGILVTNLVDNPVTGAPRSIVMRGKGTTCLGFVDGSVRTFTGPVTVEDGAFMTMYNFNSFATTPRVIVRNGANFIVKSNLATAPATMDVEIDGEVVFYLSGGGTLPRLTLNGSVSGNGTILLKDQGGITFAGTNNTFSGAATLASEGGSLACTSTTWTFDLDAADSSLTVGAGVTLPAAVSLDLSCTGEWPVVPRLLADLSGYSGSLPSFSLSAEVPKSVRLSQSGGKLYVCKSSGTTIIFR